MVSEISSVIIVWNPFPEQINGMVSMNGNTILKWQYGCMVKVNINL